MSETASSSSIRIFLQTIPIPVQAQRVLILYFRFFFKGNKAHSVHDKDLFIKIQSRNLIHDNKLLAMIPKNKDPWQDHPDKKDPSSGKKKIWAWTGIGIVCWNIGPLSTIHLNTVDERSINDLISSEKFSYFTVFSII